VLSAAAAVMTNSPITKINGTLLAVFAQGLRNGQQQLSYRMRARPCNGHVSTTFVQTYAASRFSQESVDGGEVCVLGQTRLRGQTYRVHVVRTQVPMSHGVWSISAVEEDCANVDAQPRAGRSPTMLQDFISANREAIVSRASERADRRVWPSSAYSEFEHGVALFLQQLEETLRLHLSETASGADPISETAMRHGAELFAAGFTLSQVVHDYGDICQAITVLAEEHRAAVTVREVQMVHRWLDPAIAAAVTEHARITALQRTAHETEHLGRAAHELRDLLNASLLAFQALKRGDVAINGSTGAVLGRSLMGLRDTINGALTDVRLASGMQRRERLSVVQLFDEIAATGVLHSEYRKVRFTVDAVDPTLTVDGDPQLLTSAITNLLQNAFKFTAEGGHVSLRAHAHAGRLVVEVEDECGGFPEHAEISFEPFAERRRSDRSGLGLGLAIARKAMHAHGGDIHIHNLPGKGCICVMEMPLSPSA
jgi:signal transduction histidine kinase